MLDATPPPRWTELLTGRSTSSEAEIPNVISGVKSPNPRGIPTCRAWPPVPFHHEALTETEALSRKMLAYSGSAPGQADHWYAGIDDGTHSHKKPGKRLGEVLKKWRLEPVTIAEGLACPVDNRMAGWRSGGNHDQCLAVVCGTFGEARRWRPSTRPFLTCSHCPFFLKFGFYPLPNRLSE